MAISKLTIVKTAEDKFKLEWLNGDGGGGSTEHESFEDATQAAIDIGADPSDLPENPDTSDDQDLEGLKTDAADEKPSDDSEAPKGSLDSVPEEATSGGTTEHQQYQPGETVPSAEGGAADESSEA